MGLKKQGRCSLLQRESHWQRHYWDESGREAATVKVNPVILYGTRSHNMTVEQMKN